VKEVTPDIVKIKVSFKFLPRESPFYDLAANNWKYTVSYYYLTPESNTTAVLNENTMIKGTMD